MLPVYFIEFQSLRSSRMHYPRFALLACFFYNVIYVAKPHENQIPDDNTYALIQVDKAKLYVDDMHTPVLCVDHMKHGKDAEGYFKNLMIENV